MDLFRGCFRFVRGLCLLLELSKQDQCGPRRSKLAGFPTRHGRLIDPELLREAGLRNPEASSYRSDVNHGRRLCRLHNARQCPLHNKSPDPLLHVKRDSRAIAPGPRKSGL